MLDINIWSKFYWENQENHWENLAKQINHSDPHEAAINVSQKIKKINNDYFQECAELSLGYYPTVETEKKYKKLKKQLGDKVNNIDLNCFIDQLTLAGEKGNVFFYYFEKQIQLDEKKDIILKLNHYDKTLVNYLKHKIILENDDKTLESYHTSLTNHLTSMVENEEEEKVKFVIDFFNKEKTQNWFKNNLNHILNYRTFLLYIANMIEYCEDNIKDFTDFLKNNAENSKLIDVNTNILAYIESFTQEERFMDFVKNMPLESSTAFKKIIFGDITTIQSLQKWYELVVVTEKTPKDFLEKVWNNPRKGMKISFTIEPDSILLDFFAEKICHFYTKEEMENYNFTKAIIHHNNLQEIMQKKLNYYYLSNKLSPNNKKHKKMKI